MKKKVLLLIPARYQSTRFPGKPLALVSGISMIARVYNNINIQSSDKYDFHTVVVTDDQRISDHVASFGGNVVMVSDDVISGTLRIELAYRRFFKDLNYDLIVNVQGDEPLLLGSEVINLVDYHFKSKVDIGTLVKKINKFDSDFFDSNKVKAVIREKDGVALYFSRSPIPYKRDKSESNMDYWYLHIGVYSFTPRALQFFAKSSESRLEFLEKLEQLRALEEGLTIGTIKTDLELCGVDTEADLKKVESLINH